MMRRPPRSTLFPYPTPFRSAATRPRMLIFGAIDFAAALSRAGRFLGYHVTVCDARPVFADGDVIAEESAGRSEEHTSELQSRLHLVCRLLLQKKNVDRDVVQ